MKILNCNFFCSSICSLFLVSCLVFSLKSLFLIFVFFLILSYVFCSTSLFLVSKKTKLKNTNFWSKGGLQHNGFFFYEPVFCKMWKVIVFWGAFFGRNFWLCFKKHYTNRHFSTFFKAKNYKKRHFWMLLSGPSWLLLSGPSWVRLKKRQLGPDNNIQIFSAQLFSMKMAETPIFIVFFDNRCFIKTNLDQIITFKRAKLGPDNNSTAVTLKNSPQRLSNHFGRLQLQELIVFKFTMYHWAKMITYCFFGFWRIIFSNNYRKIPGAIDEWNVMIGVVFLGSHEYIGYRYSFSLLAVWELITVM